MPKNAGLQGGGGLRNAAVSVLFPFALAQPDTALEFIRKLGCLFSVDENGLTLMHYAANIGSTDVIQDLLKEGVALNAFVKKADDKQQWPIDLAIAEGKWAAFVLLWRAQGDVGLDIAMQQLSRFYQAAFRHCLVRAEWYEQTGMDITEFLHEACESLPFQDREIWHLLLAAKNTIDDRGVFCIDNQQALWHRIGQNGQQTAAQLAFSKRLAFVLWMLTDKLESSQYDLNDFYGAFELHLSRLYWDNGRLLDAMIGFVRHGCVTHQEQQLLQTIRYRIPGQLLKYSQFYRAMFDVLLVRSHLHDEQSVELWLAFVGYQHSPLWWEVCDIADAPRTLWLNVKRDPFGHRQITKETGKIGPLLQDRMLGSPAMLRYGSGFLTLWRRLSLRCQQPAEAKRQEQKPPLLLLSS